MFARVSSIKATSDRIDASIADFRDNMIPVAKRINGFKGAYLLADRENGHMLGITFWETEEDLKSSEAEANRLRSQGAHAAASTQPPAVERYEVVYQPIGMAV